MTENEEDLREGTRNPNLYPYFILVITKLRLPLTIVLYLLNYYLQIKEIILSIFNVPGVISLALNKLEHVDLKLYWKLLLFKLDHFNNIFLCASKNLTCYFCCHGKKKKKKK